MHDLILPGVGTAIQSAATNAAISAASSSSTYRTEMDRMIVAAMKRNEEKIQNALDDAVNEALSDKTLIQAMISKAIIESASSMEGQFTAIMKRVAKDLALDRPTLEKLVEAIRLEAAKNAEKLGMGLFS